MAQQNLHGAQIGPALKHMGREGMAQRMGRNITRIQARFQRTVPDNILQRPPPDMSVLTRRRKDKFFRRVFRAFGQEPFANSEIVRQSLLRRATNRAEPFLLAFAQNADIAFFHRMKRRHGQSADLTCPQTGRIDQLQQAKVTPILWAIARTRIEELSDLFTREHFWNAALGFRRAQPLSGISVPAAFFDFKSVKLAERRETPRNRSRREPLIGKCALIRCQVFTVCTAKV